MTKQEFLRKFEEASKLTADSTPIQIEFQSHDFDTIRRFDIHEVSFEDDCLVLIAKTD